MAFAIGHISGCHINPAVTVGLWACGRFKAADVVLYVVVQVIGAIAAAWVLSIIAAGNGSDPIGAGLAANGYAEHSPGNYGLGAAALTEIVMTFFFLIVILGATDRPFRSAWY
jgi:aquaporin Z